MAGNLSLTKCKLCRRAGEKLFLKGERCATPKCAVTRKPYAPGTQGRSLRKNVSDFGRQLTEKQKLRRIYGVSESQFQKHLGQAQKKQGILGDNLIAILETRLDNVVFRMGLADSRSQARQVVGHGMVNLNGRSLNIPSANVRVGDEVEVKVAKQEKTYFKQLKVVLAKKNQTPQWISMDPKSLKGKVLSLPKQEEVGLNVDVATVIEFYSRA